MSKVFYFPILRAKAGEVSGIATLAPRTKTLVRPILDFPVRDDMLTPDDHFASVAMALAKGWGTALPLYLDLSRHNPDSVAFDGSPLVARLFDVARQAHLLAIPVVGPVLDRKGRTGKFFEAVANIARRDRRGVAIRIPYHDLVSPDTLAKVVDDIQLELMIDDGECDVFLDAGPSDSLPGGLDTAGEVLKELLSLSSQSLERRKFRNLVVVGSSIPKSRKGMTGNGPFRVSNFEFQVWAGMLNSKSYRQIRFGDYGARFANQTDKKAKARAPARIHLTTSKSHVLHVGKGPTYRDLANKIASSPEFHEQLGTWGKHSVRDAGEGGDNVGNSTDWVARDTNMHIETIAGAVEGRLREVYEPIPTEELVEISPHEQGYLPFVR